MGNCNWKSQEENNTSYILKYQHLIFNSLFILYNIDSKTNFQFHYVIGKGGFSKV